MKLNGDTYRAGGMTALLDAVGKTIDEVGTRLANEADENRPEKVIFLVITDGQENSSREYKLDQIQEKIKHQEEKYQWEFVFMGSTPEAFTGGKATFGHRTSHSYAGQSAGQMLGAAGNAVRCFRSGGTRDDVQASVAETATKDDVSKA